MSTIGSNASLGYVEETVWASGTPTINQFIPFISETFKLERNIVATDAIRGNASRSIWREGAERINGDINLEIQPTGAIGTLLKHALGRVETAGPSGTDSYYVHDIYPSGSLPAGLKFQVDRDNKFFTYKGCKVNSLSLECAVGDPLMATFSFLGHSEEYSAVGTASTSISTLNPLTFDEGVFTLDGTEAEVQSFSLNIANNLKEDKGQLGSRYRAAIPRSGFRDVTGTLNLEFDDFTFYSKYYNGTEASMALKFTADDLIDTADAYAFWIECPRIIFTGETPTISGPDVVYHDMPFTAFATDSPSEEWQRYEVRMKLINGSSSI
uniref:Putative tail protein n=1 Tax=viral metagenome TaxID=1070528 RepID=A0A6M3KG59_9ZZZZ